MMDFRDYLENEPFNVVIDFPGRTIPRIRVYWLKPDPDIGVVCPHEVIEFPTTDVCKTVGSFVFVNGGYPSYPHSSEPKAITTMVAGLTHLREMLTQWGEQYQAELGVEMFPSPSLVATITTQKVYEVVAWANDVFSNGHEYLQPPAPQEEEYRPGNYI